MNHHQTSSIIPTTKPNHNNNDSKNNIDNCNIRVCISLIFIFGMIIGGGLVLAFTSHVGNAEYGGEGYLATIYLPPIISSTHRKDNKLKNEPIKSSTSNSPTITVTSAMQSSLSPTNLPSLSKPNDDETVTTTSSSPTHLPSRFHDVVTHSPTPSTHSPTHNPITITPFPTLAKSRRKKLPSFSKDQYIPTYAPYIPLRGKRVKDFYPARDFSKPGIIYGSTYNKSLPTCVSNDLSQYPIWKECDKPCLPHEMQDTFKKSWNFTFPLQTSQGYDSGEYINQILRAAWGPNPPRIDLYVRTGCRGAYELRVLLKSMTLFWPRFLGDVLLVLDHGDEPYLNYLIPDLTNPTHSYRIVYEHCPCMDGRFFNQYSYLNLDRHTDASYVVTIDSDCVFHSPITPDFLFNATGYLKMATSTTFQGGMWLGWQYRITGIAASNFGHSMVTQPVSVATESLRPFFDWIQKQQNGTCYEQLLYKYRNDMWDKAFCWMCQLNLFLAITDGSGEKYGVDVHLVDKRRDPYIRFVVHFPYENRVDVFGVRIALTPEELLNLVMNEGLCRWFGEAIFPTACSLQVPTHSAGTRKANEFLYLEGLMMKYTDWYINPLLSPNEVKLFIANMVKQFRDSSKRIIKNVLL
jgi:hypothetical protein